MPLPSNPAAPVPQLLVRELTATEPPKAARLTNSGSFRSRVKFTYVFGITSFFLLQEHKLIVSADAMKKNIIFELYDIRN